MKWTNPGHQLDSLGETYLKVRSLYLFGIDDKAKKAFDLLQWLGVEQEFDIFFVLDITVIDQMQEHTFCGRPIIAFQTEMCEQVRKAPAETAVALPWIAQVNEREIIEKLGVKNIYYLLPSHNRRDNFIQNFICVWLMYRHGKLLSHWTNFLTTSRCNLNCQCCLNFNNDIKTPKDVPFEEFKENIDMLFSKFDYLYSLHFTGGEPALVKELPKYVRYLYNNYRDRIFEFFVITNGTVVPSSDLIHEVGAMNGRFLVDDYSKTLHVTKIEQITAALKEQRVECSINTVDHWFDLDVRETDNSTFSKAELESYKDSCNSYLQEFGEKRLFACCYQQYAHRVGLADLEDGDYIDLASASKMEILEFRQGYSKNGYTSLCKHCRGIGEYAKFVPAAVQISQKSTAPEAFVAPDELVTGRVSICVPIYNTDKYLERCVKSLLSQTYKNLEIILTDDGSTDSSFSICQKYAALDSRIVVFHKENGGEASARNVCLSNASGEYVMFVDSDDEYLPNAVELLVQDLQGQETDLSIGGYLERRESAEHFAIGHLRKYTVREFAEVYLNSTCTYDLPYIATTVNAKLFRRSILTQNDIHFDERFVIGNDAVFMCDYIRHISGVSNVFAPIYIYYKYNAEERIQGMGWYYPDTFFLFALVADRMIDLLQPSKELYRKLVIKQYVDLLYGLLNAAANEMYLERGLLPYLKALREEVRLFQLGAQMDLTENCVPQEEGSLPIRLISYLIANEYDDLLCALLRSLCKTRNVAPYLGEMVRPMVKLKSSMLASIPQNAKIPVGNSLDDQMERKYRLTEDTLLVEQIDQLVATVLTSRQMVDACALKASEAEGRASEAEGRASEAEGRASEAEGRASEAEGRASEAESRASEAEKRASEAESRAVQAEKNADAYCMEYYGLLHSRSWKITKPLRMMMNGFRNRK